MIDLLLALCGLALYYCGRRDGWNNARADFHCPECRCDNDDDFPVCPPDPRSLMEVTR